MIGGGVFVGLRHATEVRGDTEPLELSETYTQAEPGFSFRYPRGFRVNEIPQGEGNALVLVEDPACARQGFQVFSMPYDEDEPLTEARIRADVGCEASFAQAIAMTFGSSAIAAGPSAGTSRSSHRR